MANYDIGPRIGIDGEREYREQIKNITQQMKTLDSALQKSASEFDDLTTEEDKNAKKTDTLKQKIALQSDQLKKQSEMLESARKKLGENSTEAQKWEEIVNRSQTTLNNLNQELFDTQNSLLKTSEKFKEAGENLKATGDKISSIGKTLTKSITLPIAGAAVASFKYASDLEENINKTDVAFGNNADEVKKWSKTTLERFGLAQSTALEMAATWGDMGTSMDLPLDTATEMSKTLVGLAADMASFKNISVERAQTALNAVYTGETESLKDLGVVMTETNLKEYAMTKGITKSYSEMSQAEKVALRYEYVLEKTANAQGDFERTSDGAANQMRITQESVKELAAEFGQELLPIGAEVLKNLNALLKSFSGLDDNTKSTIIRIGLFAAALGPVVSITGKTINGIGKMSEGISKLTQKIDAANPKIKSLTSFIAKNSLEFGLLGIAAGGLAISFTGITDAINKTIQPTKDLADAFANSAPDLETYNDYISSVNSALSDFDLFSTSAGDAINNYSDKIDNATDNIHNIISTASAESRLMTESEYEEIQNLIGIIDDYTEKKLDAYKEQQNVVASLAETEERMTQERSAELVKAAEEARDQTIAIANEKYTSLIAEAEQMYAAGTIEEKAYDEMRKKAYDTFQQQKKDADLLFAETNASISEKFLEQQVLSDGNVKHWKDYFAALDMAQSDHENRVSEIRQREREGFISHEQAEAEIMASSEKIANDRDALLRQMVSEGADAWDEDTQNMVSYWLTMASNTELYGGKVTDKEKAFVLDFGKIMDTLPGDMKEAGKNAMLGFLDEVEAETPSILSAASGIAGGFINTIKNIFGIHSPSRVMKEIAKNTWAGWKIETDYESKTIDKQAQSVARGIQKSFVSAFSMAHYGSGSQSSQNSASKSYLGPTLNQTNNFYSPKALSPAETARLNRNNVRATIRALGG